MAGKIEKGWLIRIGYPAADQELKWGEYRDSRAPMAKALWKNLSPRAYRAQLLKDGRLVCEVQSVKEVVTYDDFSLAEFLGTPGEEPAKEERSDPFYSSSSVGDRLD